MADTEPQTSWPSFAARQAVEIPLFAIGWQVLYFAVAWSNNVLSEALSPLPIVIAAWIRLAVLYFAVGVVLVYARYALFEVLFRSTPYITPRPVPNRIDLFTWDRVTVSLGIITAGAALLVNREIVPVRWLTVGDHLQLLALWLATDLVYFLAHLAMHGRRLYGPIHAHHHRAVRRPNALADPDRFSPIEGLWNFAVSVLVFELARQAVPLSPDLLILAAIQWWMVGQFQHGGKDIPVNQVPGLEIARRLAGVRHSMCLQHDAHHIRMSRHFSMTGIFDRWLLPERRRESPYRSVSRSGVQGVG
ncbi:MAG: sterol desaturase family protein [Myxococcota bacterium]